MHVHVIQFTAEYVFIGHPSTINHVLMQCKIFWILIVVEMSYAS